MILIPPGVKEERDRRPRWLRNYIYSSVKAKSLTIAALFDIKHVQALDHLIREVEIADPALGPVYPLKSEISNGFYRIALRPGDAPNLGLFLTSAYNIEDLVAIPPTLPMGWNNSLTIF